MKFTMKSVICVLCSFLCFTVSLRPECQEYYVRDKIKISIQTYGNDPYNHLNFRCLSNFTELDLPKITNCSYDSINSVRFDVCQNFELPIENTLSDIGVRASKVIFLTIATSKLTNLTEEKLKGFVNLEHLSLFDDKINSISNGAFLHNINLKNLIIHDTTIKILPSDVFSPLSNLKNLILKLNLEILPYNILVNNTNLESVRIFSNLIKEIPSTVFSNLVKLKNITLFNNKISILNESTFAQNINLERLDLKSNLLSDLPESLFSNCPNLQMLDLSKNKIQHLPNNIFKNNRKLKRLNVSNNLLTNLSHNLIVELTELEHFSASNNMLSDISDSFFSSSNKLKLIRLNNNSISSLPNDAFYNCFNLEELQLNRNKLERISSGHFSNRRTLKKIDLSHNQLTFSGINDYESHASLFLQTQINIEEINLSHNKLERPPNGMYLYIYLKSLDLSYNKIKTFSFLYLGEFLRGSKINLNDNMITSVNMFYTPVPKQMTLSLLNNPFNCDCKMHALASFLQGNKGNFENVVIEHKNQLNCTTPVLLKNRRLTSVDLNEFTCDDPFGPASHCSNVCNCTRQPSTKTLFISCSNRELTEIPQLRSSVSRLGYSLSLNLSSNSIRNFSFPDIYQKMTALDLSKNNIGETDMDGFPSSIFDHLKFLNLRENKFTNFPEGFLKDLLNSSLTVDLSSNPLECGCKLKLLHSFLQKEFLRVRNLGNVICKGYNTPLQSLSLSDICLSSSKLALSIVLPLICMLITVILSAMYFRYKLTIRVWLFSKKWTRWLVTEEIVDADKEYDAFISYSHEDETYVNETLLPGLEQGHPPFKVCLHYRDWIPGELIQTQIIESVKKSRRTIVVLSNHFINSVWAQVEFREAHHKALEENANRVIVIVYGDMPAQKSLGEELKHYVSSRTYLQWDHPKFWDNLRYAMPHKTSKLKLRQPIKMEDLSGISNGGFNHTSDINQRNIYKI